MKNEDNQTAKIERDRKWANAVAQAKRTAAWAKTMTKVVIAQSARKSPPWHIINFLGPLKAESRGIVDLIAIRRNHTDPEPPLKKGDLFEIVLIQVKGGSAKTPTPRDIERLELVSKAYGAKAVILSAWKKGKMPVLSILTDRTWVELKNGVEIFGPKVSLKVEARTGEDISVEGTVPPSVKIAKRGIVRVPESLKSDSVKKGVITRKN